MVKTTPTQNQLSNQDQFVFSHRLPGDDSQSTLLGSITHPSEPTTVNLKGGLRFQNEITEKDESARPLWTPILLRRWAMVSIASLFAILLIPLIALYVSSKRNHGVSRIDNRYYYVWTYGPPAVFMVLAAVWSRVQYRAMQLIPWALMLQQPQPASRGILLNYLSDWIVTALIRSCRQKHFIVTLTILGSLLLTGSTVFSTGLLAMHSVAITSTAPMEVTQVFNGTGFDPEAVDSLAYGQHLVIQRYNASNQLGFNGNHAFPVFYPQSSPVESRYRVGEQYRTEADVFTMETQCEEVPTFGRTETTAQFGGPVTWTAVDVTHPNCTFTPWLEFSGVPTEYSLSTNLRGCNEEVPGTQGLDYRAVDWRLVVIVMGPGVNSTARSRSEDQVKDYTKAIVCTANYNIASHPISLTVGQSSADIRSEIHSSHSPGRKLDGVTPSNMLNGVWRSISDSTIGSIDISPLLVGDGPQESAKFWDIGLLRERVHESITTIGANVAGLYLLQSANYTTNGTIHANQDRLLVQDISFILVASILLLLLAVSGMLALIYLPLAVCPRDPGSVAGSAAIFAQSEAFVKDLIGLGATPEQEMTSLLSGRQYSTSVTKDGAFAIIPEFAASNHFSTTRAPGDRYIEWWRPIAARLPWRFITMGMPAVLIAALEVLYQYSNKSNGIAQIDADRLSAVHYTWTYIPAAVALAVRLLYHEMETSATVFQKFHQLQNGEAEANVSILEDHSGKLSIFNFVDAVRKGYWALAGASLAVLVSFGLPIAVSGLYNPQVVAYDQAANFTQIDYINISGEAAYRNLTDYNGYDESDVSTRLPSLIMYQNLTYPQWTYGDLAFPKETLDHLSTFNGSVDIRMPAVRSNMNCSELPPSHYTYKGVAPAGYNASNPNPSVNWEIQFTLHSLGDCVYKSTSCYPPNGGGYFGGSDWTLDFDTPREAAESYCAPRLYAYGRWSADNEVEEATVLQCHPFLEEVDVDVRLWLPSYTIDTAKPPVVLANSSRVLASRVFRGSTGWQDIFVAEGSLVDFLQNPQSGQEKDRTQELGASTVAAIYGVNGTSPEELLDPMIYAAGLSRVYGLVMTQLLGSNGRIAFEDPSSRPVHPATLIDQRLVLLQSLISTRIVEGILAAMFVSAVVAIGFMNTRSVLPKNPTTIASMASLLAGSELLTDNVFPPGSEWCNDQELQRRELFKNKTFSLGWWPAWRGGDAPGERYGIDYDA